MIVEQKNYTNIVARREYKENYIQNQSIDQSTNIAMKSYKRPYKKEELIELQHNLSFKDATDIAITHISNEVEIQRLWAGYGAVSSFRVSVVAKRNTGVIDMIVKRVCPPMGDLDDVSHMRKVKSYFVEAHFYSKLVPRLNRVWEGG